MLIFTFRNDPAIAENKGLGQATEDEGNGWVQSLALFDTHGEKRKGVHVSPVDGKEEEKRDFCRWTREVFTSPI